MWIRTCNECGNKQKDTEPNPDKELTNAYRNRACKRCKSPGLDFGKDVDLT